MILYHTSNIVVNSPDTAHSRKNIDFGAGFYLTSIRQQAVDYGNRFKNQNQEAWINIFELADNLEEYKIKFFPEYNEEWLDFVVANRSGQETEYFDLIIGGIANDKVIRTLELYVAGLISKDETLGRIKYEKTNIQYCIRSERLLQECIRFVKSERL